MTTPNFTRLRWQKSSRSVGNGNCVEVTEVNKVIGIRDSKLRKESPILTFDQNKWVSFLDAIKRGDANLS
jgi:hypothetical protein